MAGVRAIDARDADLQAAVKRGQVQADLFGTVRAIGRLAGFAALLLGSLAAPVGYAALWILVPNVVTGRWVVWIAAAVLALVGLATAWAGLGLCQRARDVATLRARMAAVARLCTLLAAPGLLLLGLVVATGGRGTMVQTAGWMALQLGLAPLGLAAVLACCVAATPRDRGSRPDRPRGRRPALRAVLAVAVGAVVLPLLLPDGRSLWPHRPLPDDPEAAVAMLDRRARWERGWRFRATRAFPWGKFVAQAEPTGTFPTLDTVWMDPALARRAIEEVARAAIEDAAKRELLRGLIATPTLPVRIRETAIQGCEQLGALPPEIEAALVEVCVRPAVALGADMTNWAGHLPSTAAGGSALVASEDKLRVAAIGAFMASGARSPAVVDALRSLRHHPRLNIYVKRLLERLDEPGAGAAPGGVPQPGESDR